MVDLVHKDLVDAKLHQTKGAASASAGEVLTGVGDGTATYQVIPTPARYLTVSASGADHTNIADAISAATALTPTAANPVVLQVFPGTYNTTPLVLPAFVSITGSDGPSSTIIGATSATSALVTMGDLSHLHSVTLRGANGIGGIGLQCTTGAEVRAESVSIRDCETAIDASGSGTDFIGTGIKILRASGEVLTTGVNATGASVVTINGIKIQGISGTLITTGINLTTSSVVTVTGLDLTYCTVGASTISSSLSEISGSVLKFCGTGILVGASGIAHIVATSIEDSTVDLQVLDATGAVRSNGCIFTHEKVDVHVDSDSLLSYISETPGDQAFKIEGELHVGTEDRPRESAFGGGDSHVRGMSAKTNSNLEAGSWVDITSSVNSDDGSSVNIFAGVTTGNCVYVGGDLPFPGLKADVTLALVVGSGTVVSEFWNGSAWTEFNTLSSDATTPYQQYANVNLTRVMVDQIRFDFPKLSTWALKTLDGDNKYWARYCITADITTIPQVDIFKLHTSRLEINSDGVLESFGDGEKARDIPLGIYQVSSLEAPGTAAISYAVGITGLVEDNIFSNNVIKGRVYAIEVPTGLDTSRDSTIKIPWVSATAGSGDVEIEVDYVVLNPGDVLDGTAVATSATPSVTSVSGDLDVLQNAELTISLPQALPGGLLVLKIFRDASGSNPEDTLAGNIELVAEPILIGTFWR